MVHPLHVTSNILPDLTPNSSNGYSVGQSVVGDRVTLFEKCAVLTVCTDVSKGNRIDIPEPEHGYDAPHIAIHYYNSDMSLDY